MSIIIFVLLIFLDTPEESSSVYKFPALSTPHIQKMTDLTAQLCGKPGRKASEPLSSPFIQKKGVPKP